MKIGICPHGSRHSGPLGFLASGRANRPGVFLRLLIRKGKMDQYQGIVCAQYLDAYRVYLPHQGNEVSARLSGSLRQKLKQERTLLVTGDRVALDREGDEGGSAVILALVPRETLLSRVEAGIRGQRQPLAANVDYAFICTSLNEEFNLSRLDRYLAIADGACIQPVLLMTKADAVQDWTPYTTQIMTLRPPRAFILCSAVTGCGIAEIKTLLAAGKTAVLLGSSGVGKSSLVNALLGETRMHTARISGFQDKGRHTTTSRELIALPGCGYLIDTPGMRELKLDNSDVEASFADIMDLSVNCKFRDCRHLHEPGCAVKAAVERGELNAKRLRSFQKLRDEEACRRKRR